MPLWAGEGEAGHRFTEFVGLTVLRNGQSMVFDNSLPRSMSISIALSTPFEVKVKRSKKGIHSYSFRSFGITNTANPGTETEAWKRLCCSNMFLEKYEKLQTVAVYLRTAQLLRNVGSGWCG